MSNREKGLLVVAAVTTLLVVVVGVTTGRLEVWAPALLVGLSVVVLVKSKEYARRSADAAESMAEDQHKSTVAATYCDFELKQLQSSDRPGELPARHRGLELVQVLP